MQTVLRTGCVDWILGGSLSGREKGKRTCVHDNPLKDTAHSVANTDEMYKKEPQTLLSMNLRKRKILSSAKLCSVEQG